MQRAVIQHSLQAAGCSIEACTQPQLLLLSTLGRQLGTSTGACSSSEAENAGAAQEATEQPSSSTESSASQQAAAGGRSGRARHISLDDPELNVYLRHNTEFLTDMDRSYFLGYARSMERKQRLELRKALAAHRLGLRDAALAAAAAGGSRSRQLSLHDQMRSRLAEMQSYMSNMVQQ